MWPRGSVLFRNAQLMLVVREINQLWWRGWRFYWTILDCSVCSQWWICTIHGAFLCRQMSFYSISISLKRNAMQSKAHLPCNIFFVINRVNILEKLLKQKSDTDLMWTNNENILAVDIDIHRYWRTVTVHGYQPLDTQFHQWRNKQKLATLYTNRWLLHICLLDIPLYGDSLRTYWFLWRN